MPVYHNMIWASKTIILIIILIIDLTTKYHHLHHHRHHHKISSSSSCPDRPDQTPGGPVFLPPKAGSHRPGYLYIFISFLCLYIFIFFYIHISLYLFYLYTSFYFLYNVLTNIFSLFWLWGQGLKLKYVVIFWLFTKQSDPKVGTRSPLLY